MARHRALLASGNIHREKIKKTNALSSYETTSREFTLPLACAQCLDRGPKKALHFFICPSYSHLETCSIGLRFPTDFIGTRQMKAPEPMVVDLFSGAGGLSLGASRAGFVVRGAVDTDRQAMDAHKANFRETYHLFADISELTGEELRSAIELKDIELSGIIGGPPCQGFSYMGRQNEHDGRNQLFVDFFRGCLKTL